MIIEDLSGELDIDCEGSTYKILSTINLPFGKIALDDNFVMEDVFHIKNDLHIDLSFNNIKEITSFYTFLIDMENNPTYFMDMSVNVRKNTTWIEVCRIVKFLYQRPQFLPLILEKRTNEAARYSFASK